TLRTGRRFCWGIDSFHCFYLAFFGSWTGKYEKDFAKTPLFFNTYRARGSDAEWFIAFVFRATLYDRNVDGQSAADYTLSWNSIIFRYWILYRGYWGYTNYTVHDIRKHLELWSY